jgi:hypothetical protein
MSDALEGDLSGACHEVGHAWRLDDLPETLPICLRLYEGGDTGEDDRLHGTMNLKGDLHPWIISEMGRHSLEFVFVLAVGEDGS